MYGNSAATRLEALPVTITQVSGSPTLSPNPYTLYADQNGCIFAQVPVGTYDVAIQQPTAGTPPSFSGYPGAPPFVDTTGSTDDEQDNQVVTVTAEQTVNLDAFDESINSSISYGGASAVDDGVSCPGAASVPCVTTGDGTTGATAAWGSASSTWTSTTLGAGTEINQVDCTNTASAYCVGVGLGPSGGLIETHLVRLQLADGRHRAVGGDRPAPRSPVPRATGCYALGQSGSGPVVLAGYVGSGTDQWIVVPHPGVTLTGLDSIACPTTTTCEIAYAGIGGAAGCAAPATATPASSATTRRGHLR